MCVYVCVCVRACVRVCVTVCVCFPRKRFLRKLLKSSMKLSMVTACLRHENASRVNYIDLDLHLRSHIF